jgi:hypothetical protein
VLGVTTSAEREVAIKNAEGELISIMQNFITILQLEIASYSS